MIRIITDSTSSLPKDPREKVSAFTCSTLWSTVVALVT